jgi:hypothetical protein
MSWLKIRYSLPEDWRIKNRAKHLGIELDSYLGKLLRFWIYASVFSKDGWMPGLQPNMIDLMFDLAGFCKSLEHLQWIRVHGNDKPHPGIQICNWNDHLSPDAKLSVVASLAAAPPVEPPKQSDMLFPTPEPAEVVRPLRGLKKTYPGFDRFWELYPRKQGKILAGRAWNKLQPDEELVEWILKALHAQCAWPDWIRDNGQYIPYPATWLNGHRWNDLPTQAPKPILVTRITNDRQEKLQKEREDARAAEARKSSRPVLPVSEEQKQRLLPPAQVKAEDLPDDPEMFADLPGFYDAYLGDE